jgi:hypothetical protein
VRRLIGLWVFVLGSTPVSDPLGVAIACGVTVILVTVASADWIIGG